MTFEFLHAEIGVDTARIIEWVQARGPYAAAYVAHPNRDTMAWWHQYEPRPYTFDRFAAEFVDVLAAANPDLLLVESGSSLETMRNLIRQTGLWGHCFESNVTYSAPATKDGHGMAKRRTSDHTVMMRWTRSAVPTPRVSPGETSHAYLEREFAVLPPGSTVFDPCIGRGLTSLTAHRFGLSAVGVDSNPDRLKAARLHVAV